MRTCCPDCATVFRISAEQLRARNGMVRCGQCRGVFNAFDSLIEEDGPVIMPAAQPRPVAAPAPSPSPSPVETLMPEAASALPDIADNLVRLEALRQDLERALEIEVPPAPEPAAEQGAAPAPEASAMDETFQTHETPEPSEPPTAAQAEPVAPILPSNETPEESSRAAREAGLAAVRELSESPGYDRWSAGALHLDASGRIVGDSTRRPLWPFVTAAVILVGALMAQMAYHFRAELTQRMPELAGTYAALNIAIPLPRNVDLVTIETSDLQSDNARGLLVLQATLKNRAPYAQAWPALELTLTDTNDTVVARRVLNAADYLPPKADAASFAGASEIGLKLWLEAKQPAAGYRLYVFYP